MKKRKSSDHSLFGKHPFRYRVQVMRRFLKETSFGSMLCALLGFLVVMSFAYFLLKPSVHPVAIVRDENIRHIDSWAETVITKPHSDHDVIVHVWSPLPFGKLQLYVDDCVQRMYVNGRAVNDKRFPYCNWYDHVTVDISEFAHIGSNTVTVTLHNNRGSGRLRVTSAYASWLFTSVLGVFLLAISCFGAWWFMRQRHAAGRVTVAFIILGTLLRVFYAAYTEFDTRAYDWDGHMEYFTYVADHWVIPEGNKGWEFHQQPLYYVIGASVLTVMRFLHAVDSFPDVMRFLSLLLSLGTLFACGWIGTMLFPHRQKHAAFERFAFIGLIATLPGIVMFTTRVNNDVPTLFFASLAIAFLLSWWKHGSFEKWATASSFVTLALLTKSSALPLLVPLGLALLLRKQSLRSKVYPAVFLGVLLAITLGGTFVVRVLIQGQGELVPVWVTGGLRVKNFLAAYLTFDPWQILMHPFNNNWTDEHRRQFMWEYFFKSAFFGEWSFRTYFDHGATILLSSGLLLIPAGLWGIVQSCWKPTKIASMLLAFMIVSLLALVSFRYMHPNSSNQELRYIAFVIIPFGYFLARGIASMRYRFPFAAIAMVMFIASGAFVVLASLHSR